MRRARRTALPSLSPHARRSQRLRALSRAACRTGNRGPRAVARAARPRSSELDRDSVVMDWMGSHFGKISYLFASRIQDLVVPKDTLTVVDNRTGSSYELPIQDGTIRAADLRQIKTSPDDFGLMSYDPAFMNTAACRSAISYIDGDKGILRYRGYPIEQLAEKSTFLETAYLLLNGELPSAPELDSWVYQVTHHTIIHENIKKFIDGFHHDAHPMGMFVSAVAALSTFYPEAKRISEEQSRRNQLFRLIAKTPTLAAFAHRHSVGMPYAYPDNDLSYTGNFLNMMFKTTEVKYSPHPVLERALDVLFILHADHEQNCSTSAMRGVGSSHPDPYSGMAAAAAALYGPLHGGANEEVLRMLREIGSIDAIPAYIQRVKQGDVRLMGFGHRVYKNFDPRAKIIKQIAERSEEHTSELQSQSNLVCRLLLEKKKKNERKCKYNTKTELHTITELCSKLVTEPESDKSGQPNSLPYYPRGRPSELRSCTTLTRC